MRYNLLTDETKSKVIELLKSFGYKVALYALVTGTALLAANLHLLALPTWLAVTIGLVLGEIHSWAESRYNLQAKVAGAIMGTRNAVARAVKF